MINSFIRERYRVKVVIVKKEVLETLVSSENWDYVNLFPEGRRPKKMPVLLTAIINMVKAEYRLLKFAWKSKPDILLGTEGTLAHVGFFLRKPAVLFNEDDTVATPENYLFYPFATKVLLPEQCDVGKWRKKRIVYSGNHELAYLHPKYFTPCREFIKTFNPSFRRYFVIRLTEMRASHDVWKKGLSANMLRELIAILEPHGKIYISSEKSLDPEFEKYKLKINPLHMAHALYFADIYIGDSQTMATEAAVLGTPSVRFNDFVGISRVFDVTDYKYELSYGVKTSEPEKLISLIRSLINTPRLKESWQAKRACMLQDSIDVTGFYIEIVKEILCEKKRSNSKATIKQSMKILFYLNHPAHYHLFKNTINDLIYRDYPIKVAIVTKDVLERLVENEDWEYVNLFPEGRRIRNMPNIVSAIVNLLKAEFRLFALVKKEKPSILVGTEGTLAHTGYLQGIPSILFNEDDTRATPENYLFYPFATKIVVPEVCDVGKWEKKKISYPGYHELAYLHPRYFHPREDFVKTFNPKMEKYFIVRLAELTASHDSQKKGIDDSLLRCLITMLAEHGRVFITSERRLKPEFEQYRMHINPFFMTHALNFAEMYIGDSQTMTAEAAVLGTPSIRFNDFVGKLGYLEELEKEYGLTIGIKTGEKERLFNTVKDLAETPLLKKLWAEKRDRMLREKIDVCEVITNTIVTSIWGKHNVLKEE